MVSPSPTSGPTANAAPVILSMRHITKRFPGVVALDDVSFDVHAGEVHGLVGENGAGKSTLMNIMSGVYIEFSGEMRLNDQLATFHHTRDAQNAGIAMIHQELNLVPELTVYENIFLGREHKSRLGIIDRPAMRRAAEQLMSDLGLDIDTNRAVGQLRVGQRQLVEIAKALNLNARIIIMDEPSSALSDTEVGHLFHVIQGLRQRNVAVIYISHRLDEIFAVADRITVLRDGRMVGSALTSDMTRPKLISLMVGRDLAVLYPKETVELGDTLLQVEDLSYVRERRHVLDNISLYVRRGEIVGLAGLMGAGRTQVLEALFGVYPPSTISGRILLNGQPVRFASPQEAIAHGVGLVAEDRKQQSLVLERSVAENASLADNPRLIAVSAFVFRFQSFFGLIIVFILAVIFSPIRNDANIFLSQRNLSNVTRDVAETGILAVGQMLVIIIGGIDLSVGSVVALTATGVAFLLMRDLVAAIPAILIILSLGLFIGWWNGWTAERFKIPSFVTTLAMLSIARGIAHIWSSDIAVPISYGTGGADPLFEVIGERINGVFPVPAIIMFIVAIIMSLVLYYTAFGRYLYAIGGNQTAANLSGVAVTRIKIFAFMLCGFFASMAGILHAAQLNQGSPNEAVGYELNAIAAVVIGGASLSGGKGTIIGAVAGAFILGILDNMLSLNNVNSNVQLVTKGLLVVAAVALQQLKPRSAE